MATLSAKEAARELGTDARTFRKFMRATTEKEDQPGQGNRYQIESKDLKKLKKSFDEWAKPKSKTDNGSTKSKGKKGKPAVDDVDEDLTGDEDLDLSDIEIELDEDDLVVDDDSDEEDVEEL